MGYDWYKNMVANKVKSLDPTSSKEANQAVQAVDSLLHPDKNGIVYFGKFYSNLEYMIKDLKASDFAFDYFREFKKLHTEEIDYDPRKIRVSFSPEELIELTYDFYKNGTNKSIFADFSTLFDKNRIQFLSDPNLDFYADSFYLPYYRELYIQEKPLHEFNDVSTLAHEFGHGIQFLNNFDYLYHYNNRTFTEISSTFFELLCMDYYSKNPTYKEKAINTMADKLEYTKLLCDDLVEFMGIYTSLYQKGMSVSDLRKLISLYLDDDDKKEIFDDLDKANASNNAMYVFGYMIAVELYMIYLNDPDKAFYLYNQIIHIDLRTPSKEYFNKILSLGIIPNDNALEHEDNLKRRLI